MNLIESLRDKDAWFDGKWSLDDKKRSEYTPTIELLRSVANRIECLEDDNQRLRDTIGFIQRGSDMTLRGLADWNMSNVFSVADEALKKK